MKALYLILFFLSSNLFGQHNKLNVRYEVIMGDDEKFAGNDILKEYYKSAKENAKYLHFNLSINNSETYFYDNIGIGDNSSGGIEFAKAFSGFTSTTYSELNSPFYYQSFDDAALGKYVIKKQKIKYDWQLSTETKKISGFLCYKATFEDVVVNLLSGKQSKFLVTAWYTPEIPISSGPLFYNGLPGLILELDRRGVVFGVTHIEINPDKAPYILKPDLNKLKDAKEIEDFKLNYFKSKD